jgi:hypothetical protein
MTENVKNVQQVIAAVADNFVKVDGDLAKALDEKKK